MTIPSETSNEDIDALVDWLVESGFTITATRGPEGESFGNRIIEAARGNLKVRIVRDRGYGCIEIGAGGTKAYAPINQFLAWLDNIPFSLATSFENEKSILRDRLSEFDAAITDPQILKHLREVEASDLARFKFLVRRYGAGSLLARWWSTTFGRDRHGIR